VDTGGPFELVRERLAPLGDPLPAHALGDRAQRIGLSGATEAVRQSIVDCRGFFVRDWSSFPFDLLFEQFLQSDMASCRLMLEQGTCDHLPEHLALLGVFLYADTEQPIAQLRFHLAGSDRLARDGREDVAREGGWRRCNAVGSSGVVRLRRSAACAADYDRRSGCPESRSSHDCPAHIASSAEFVGD
jgi:hypothetical protein